MNINIDIDDELSRRIRKRIDLYALRKACGVDIVIAGGSMRAERPKDYDVYAARSDKPLDTVALQEYLQKKGWEVLATTRNSLTMRDTEERVFQFCSYAKEDPYALVESFDFAHCQVGLCVGKSMNPLDVDTKAVFTPSYVKAMALQGTFFTGSEYPLASLCRLPKYVKKGLYNGGTSYAKDAIEIVIAVIKRWYKDYDDFKDQLDAVDLAYSEKNAYALWKTMEARKEEFSNSGQGRSENELQEIRLDVLDTLKRVELMDFSRCGGTAMLRLRSVVDRIEKHLKAIGVDPKPLEGKGNR